jgi:beta-lactamase regulating signal transducer with metallopeptidase domain
MTAIAHLATRSEALNSALLHFLWQGVAVALLLWMGLFLLRRRSAQARYLVCCASLALLAALPVATTWILYERPFAPPVSTAAAAKAATPTTEVRPEGPTLTTTQWTAVVESWALPIWSIGVLVFSIRLVWGCGQVSLLRRRGSAPDEGLSTLVAALARRFGIGRKVRILVAGGGESPSVVGWMRPVVLIPSAALLGLTAGQLEAVLAHELAHIRRHDYLVNMLQVLVETLLFYHPAVWWVSARIRHERELCCDDLAVRACGDAVCYARALTKLVRLRIAAPAMAMGSNNGSMLYRIERLLRGSEEHTPSKVPAVLALALGVACFGLNMHWARGQQNAVAVRTNLLLDAAEAGDAPGVTVDLGGAALLHRNRVEYPGEAREHRVEGAVAVELTLDGSGIVSGARILSGPAELRSTVLHSVLDWHFAQSAANGIYRIQVQFHRAQAEAAEGLLQSELLKLQPRHTGWAVTQGNATVRLFMPDGEQQSRESSEVRHGEPLRVDMAEKSEQAAATTEFLRGELRNAEAAGSGSSEQQSRLRELRSKLRAAEEVQGIASDEPASLPGRVLKSVVVTGLSDGAKSELLAKLGIRAGDTLTEQSVQEATAAVKQFDEHLEVNFGVPADHEAELHVAAPQGGIFQFRVRQ